jgi:hypothetical protein
MKINFIRDKSLGLTKNIVGVGQKTSVLKLQFFTRNYHFCKVYFGRIISTIGLIIINKNNAQKRISVGDVLACAMLFGHVASST